MFITKHLANVSDLTKLVNVNELNSRILVCSSAEITHLIFNSRWLEQFEYDVGRLIAEDHARPEPSIKLMASAFIEGQTVDLASYELQWLDVVLRRSRVNHATYKLCLADASDVEVSARRALPSHLWNLRCAR